MKNVLWLFAALLSAASFGVVPADAAAETGEVVAVVQSATATTGDGKRTLEAGMPVAVGERIETDGNGQVQLIFADDTKLVVGPRSSLVIDAYIVRSENTASSFAVTALGGTFRFITGKSPKPAYAIKTRAAAITVRGSAFDLSVWRRHDDLVVFSGDIELCKNVVDPLTGERSCVRLTEACSMAIAPRNGDVTLQRADARRDRIILTNFPYIVSQAALLPAFRVRTESCGDLLESRSAFDRGDKADRPERSEPPEPPDFPDFPDIPDVPNPDIN